MPLYTNGGALILAGIARDALADAEVHLYQEVTPPLSVSTVIGDFTEADYSGYAAATIAAWLAPYLDPAGGASIQSGTQQFDFGTLPGNINSINGFYLVNSDGDLILASAFPAPIAMTQPGDAIPVDVVLNFGAPV